MAHKLKSRVVLPLFYTKNWHAHLEFASKFGFLDKVIFTQGWEFFRPFILRLRLCLFLVSNFGIQPHFLDNVNFHPFLHIGESACFLYADFQLDGIASIRLIYSKSLIVSRPFPIIDSNLTDFHYDIDLLKLIPCCCHCHCHCHCCCCLCHYHCCCHYLYLLYLHASVLQATSPIDCSWYSCLVFLAEKTFCCAHALSYKWSSIII